MRRPPPPPRKAAKLAKKQCAKDIKRLKNFGRVASRFAPEDPPSEERDSGGLLANFIDDSESSADAAATPNRSAAAAAATKSRTRSTPATAAAPSPTPSAPAAAVAAPRSPLDSRKTERRPGAEAQKPAGKGKDIDRRGATDIQAVVSKRQSMRKADESEAIEVFVCDSNRKTHRYGMKRATKFKNLKTMHAEDLKATKGSVRLFWRGKEVMDNDTVASLNVGSGERLYSAVISR